MTVANVAGFGYLAAIGGALAYTLWFRGIERLGARNATFLALLSPVVATIIGVLAGERLSAWQLTGAVAVLASIVDVQRPTRPADTTKTPTRVSAGVAVLPPTGNPQVANS